MDHREDRDRERKMRVERHGEEKDYIYTEAGKDRATDWNLGPAGSRWFPLTHSQGGSS